MIDKIFLLLFSPERLFLPLFFSDVQMFRTIIYFGLIWFRHFLNFTAAYLMYDYHHIWSTYLHVKIFGWLIGLRASPDKLDEIAWVSGLPTPLSLFRFHLCPFSQKRLILMLLTWPLTWRRLVQFACEMDTPYLTILIWSHLEERSCLSKRIPGDVLVFASNNCKLGESIRWGRRKGGEW